VFVVEQAELMTAAAQNALLKTLEEPAGRTLIVLLTTHASELLPTVRSRCQTIGFAPLERELVVKELRCRGVDAATAATAAELADGSLGVALRWIEDGMLTPAAAVAESVDSVLAGRASDLANLLRASADAYAQKVLERDELASKDSATRTGLGVYLGIASKRIRRRLGDADVADRACAAIDAIARAEKYLDANVNLAVVLEQLAIAV
jgi:DNA polymerase-3 subunit delta'